jgi:hypothetical protein
LTSNPFPPFGEPSSVNPSSHLYSATEGKKYALATSVATTLALATFGAAPQTTGKHFCNSENEPFAWHDTLKSESLPTLPFSSNVYPKSHEYPTGAPSKNASASLLFVACFTAGGKPQDTGEQPWNGPSAWLGGVPK